MMTILIIDDGKDLYKHCKQFLKGNYKLLYANCYSNALKILKKEAIQVILLDKVFNLKRDLLINEAKNPKTEGYAIAKAIKKNYSQIPIIMISLYNPSATAEKTLEFGIDDFIEWEALSLDPEILNRRIEKFHSVNNSILFDKLKNDFLKLGIVGKSNSMKRIFQHIRTLSAKDTHILLTGETGVGKDLLANAIHYLSYRKEFPFIEVNLPSLPETLVENEIFGHEKGAYTDAKTEKKSVLELVGKGTVLFNEIGDLSLHVQVKLLKLIEQKMFMRIGGTKEIPVNARFIFATNKNLKELVEKKEFRRDLYYRISTNVICIPPLRERPEDILEITYFYLKSKGKKITNEAVSYLMKQKWDGNIRQLKSALENAALNSSNIVTIRDIVNAYHQYVNLEEDKINISNISETNQTLEEVEKNYIISVLERCNWYVEPAENILKISRASLYRKINKYGLKDKINGYSQK